MTVSERAVEIADRPPLARVRHDLRSPLNAITGYTEMLLEDVHPEDSDLPFDLRRLRAGASRLLVRLDAVFDTPTIERSASRPEVVAVSARLRHELRRPLGAVLCRIELLQAGAVRAGLPEVLADLDKIHLAAQQFKMVLTTLDTATEGDGTVAEARAHAPGLSSATEERAATRLTGPGTLLIVDDSELNRNVLARRLERQGHAVAAVANGREALAVLRSQSFDMVLLDIMMPEIDGYEVLRRMKADPELRDLPVVVISALGEIESAVRCIEMGAEDYLPKPFNPTLLKARVSACLEKKRLRDQEVAYLRSVTCVTEAAAAVETGTFEPADLEAISARPDALGRLSRVFQRMALEVRAREERLQRQVQELRIQVDETKKARAVAEITTTDYFRNLQDRARDLRSRT